MSLTLKFGSAILVATLALAASASAERPSPDKYCRFLADIRLTDPVSAGAGGYRVSNWFWTPADKRFRNTRPDAPEYCEVSLASTSSRVVPKGHWAHLKDASAASGKFGHNNASRFTLYVDSDLLLEPSTFECTRESPRSEPKTWTYEEMTASVGHLLECHEEPSFTGIPKKLRECKITLNQWQADLRVGRPLPEDHVRRFREDKRAFAVEFTAKCPGDFDMPSCGRARELLSCMEDVEKLLPPQAVSSAVSRTADAPPAEASAGARPSSGAK